MRTPAPFSMCLRFSFLLSRPLQEQRSPRSDLFVSVVSGQARTPSFRDALERGGGGRGEGRQGRAGRGLGKERGRSFVQIVWRRPCVQRGEK